MLLVSLEIRVCETFVYCVDCIDCFVYVERWFIHYTELF
jgi:hypothetical protein